MGAAMVGSVDGHQMLRVEAELAFARVVHLVPGGNGTDPEFVGGPMGCGLADDVLGDADGELAVAPGVERTGPDPAATIQHKVA